MTKHCFDRLLAKSVPSHQGPPPDSVFLPGHLREVYAATQQVLDATGQDQLRAMALDVSVWYERFSKIVLLSAALHDLGKANDHFQEMVRGVRNVQGLRHEWVTVLLMEQMKGWLHAAVLEDADWRVVRWVISGHHPGYNRPSPPRTPPPGSGSTMQVFLDHDDFLDCLQWMADSFPNLAGVPTSLDCRTLPLVGRDNAFARIAAIHLDDLRHWRTLESEAATPTPLVRLVAAAKNCLVAGDVAGSALPRQVKQETQRTRWIPSAFQHNPTKKQLSQLIQDRLTEERDGQVTVHDLRPFQMAVGETKGDVVFVKAGCGSGKTLAAYHRARCQWHGRRLYVCYPTTGTATEGFRDYLVSGESPKFQADLFHGRASIDLEIFHVKRDNDDAAAEAVARIESLDAWSTPIVCCTVDTVLGLVQNNRRALFAWPALAGAAFVFDEIHAYDDRLFGALLRFLSVMVGVPVLLMTASLPEHRRRALEACLDRRGTKLIVVDGPEDLEARPRYHRMSPANPADPLPEIRAELAQDGRVLWVCNTIRRALDSADKASDLNPIVYHSRFRYLDRVRRHADVIEAFQRRGPALAICTQVAEMSLDLSASLLVTDLAPVPALIQRLGRLNRRARDGDPTRPFLVIEPRREDGTLQHLPYTPEDLSSAGRWLDSLPEEGISQRTLATAWEADDEARRRRSAYVPSAWIDGGPVTQVLELREASPGVSVIMERDKPLLTARDPEQRRQLAELILPMPPPPRGCDWRNWPTVSGVPVAPNDTIH